MLDPEPHSSPTAIGPRLTRRRVLVDGGRGLLAIALAGAAVTACGPGKPPEPDPLEEELQAARLDSELATAAAKGAAPPMAAALSEVAAERGKHAAALVEELARAAGKPTPTETTETTTAAPASKPKPAVSDVIEALKKSAESAAKLVPTLSGYRAGLMGSIAASCTASYIVGLPTARATPPPADDAHLPDGPGHLPGPGPSTNLPGPPPSSAVERKPR